MLMLVSGSLDWDQEAPNGCVVRRFGTL